MTVLIHGKEYITVAERITAAGKDLVGVETEVLYTDPVVIRAIVRINKGNNICTYSGISAANASKQIEKESPYEVAETSAVGRALAFAGYETTNGIASAEEMQKVDGVKTTTTTTTTDLGKCPKCGADMKLSMQGKKYCSKLCWKNPLPDKVQEEFTAF